MAAPPPPPLPTDDIVSEMEKYISALDALLPGEEKGETPDEQLKLEVARVRQEFKAMEASDTAVNASVRTEAQINRFLGESFSFLCLQECDQDTFNIIAPIVKTCEMDIITKEKGDCAIIYDPAKFNKLDFTDEESDMKGLHDFAVVGKFNRNQSDGENPSFYVVCAHLKSGKKVKDLKKREEEVKKMLKALKENANLNLPIILSVDANCEFEELNGYFGDTLKDPNQVGVSESPDKLLPLLEDEEKVYSDHFAVKRSTNYAMQNIYEPGTEYVSSYSTYKQRGMTTEQPGKIYELIDKQTIDFIFFFDEGKCVETISDLNLDIIGKNVLKARGGDGFVKERRNGECKWKTPDTIYTDDIPPAKKEHREQDIPKLVKRFMEADEKPSETGIRGQLKRFVQVYYWLDKLVPTLESGSIKNDGKEITKLSELADISDNIEPWKEAFENVDKNIGGTEVQMANTFVQAVRWLKDVKFTANVILKGN